MRTAPRAFLLAALAAASSFVLGVAAPAAAQDPPPPLPPSDAPPAPPDAPPASALPPLAPAAAPSVVAPPVALPPTPPPAEPVPEPGARPSRDDARALKGQTFLTPALLDSAFVSTYAGLGVELGREVDSNVIIVGMNALGGQTLTYDNTLNIVTGHVQAGVSFLGRLEAGVEVNYGSLVAGDQTTAFVLGSQNTYDVRPGLRVLVLRAASTGTQIGLRAYGVFDASSRLNPAPVLAAIADQASAIAGDQTGIRSGCLEVGKLSCALPGFDAFAAMRATRTLFGGGGASVSLAQALGSRFAVQASLGGEVGARTTSTVASGSVPSTPVTFYVGVAPSLSFGRSVPLALMAEYRLDVTVESFGDSGNDLGTTTTLIQHSLAGGLYYTGRPELQLGAVVKGALTTTSSDAGDLAPTSTISGLVTMRYFF